MELNPRKLLNAAKKKFNEYKRVYKISTKPDREEFEMSAKVTGIGIILVGALGFIFYLASNLIPQLLA